MEKEFHHYELTLIDPEDKSLYNKTVSISELDITDNGDLRIDAINQGYYSYYASGAWYSITYMYTEAWFKSLGG